MVDDVVERFKDTIREPVLLVDMEVQNVEILGGVADPVKHQHVIGNGIVDVRVEPKRGGDTPDQLRIGYRIAAGEISSFSQPCGDLSKDNGIARCGNVPFGTPY